MAEIQLQISQLPLNTTLGDICKICHCGGDELITPCLCAGSIKYVHKECLTEWIRTSSDKKRCELCQFMYSTERKLKPFQQWEKPDRLDIMECLNALICFAITFVSILPLWYWIYLGVIAVKRSDSHWFSGYAVGMSVAVLTTMLLITATIFLISCKEILTKWRAKNSRIVVKEVAQVSVLKGILFRTNIRRNSLAEYSAETDVAKLVRIRTFGITEY